MVAALIFMKGRKSLGCWKVHLVSCIVQCISDLNVTILLSNVPASFLNIQILSIGYSLLSCSLYFYFISNYLHLHRS